MKRREFIALGAAAMVTSGLSADETMSKTTKPLHPEVLIPRTLNFNPKNLDGISEKMIISHHTNNYTGAIKRALLIEESISKLTGVSNPYEYGSLKREQMVALNSMILHEYYFDNLGASGSMSTHLMQALTHAFGSVSTWENEFKKSALSLGGGSGWILLVYNDRLKRVENVWAWDHMHGLWDSHILLALDMYEHSYQMDFGANAKGYVETFFKNINWNVVNDRMKRIG